MNGTKLEILYEDNHLIFVTKPSGILSQSDGSGAEDMLSLISDYLAERDRKPGKAFVGLIHRLDRNVGGAMVFAKNSKGASRASEDLRSGFFYKGYIAVSSGALDRAAGESGFLVNHLKKDTVNNRVFESRDGKDCRLYFRHLAVCRGADGQDKHFYFAVPVTGRAHQIRAQFALAGAPLIGDNKYAQAGSGRGSNSLTAGKAGQDRSIGLWSVAVSVRRAVDRSERIWAFSLPRGAAFENEDGELPEAISAFIGSDELTEILENIKGEKDSGEV